MSRQTAVSKFAKFTLIQAMEVFATDEGAREFFEEIRWPNGPICAHCKNSNQERIWKRESRPGVYKCAECSMDFTATIGTVMEDSHIPIRKWMLGFYMMCASKTQIAALQLQRQLELGSYRTALFMCQRIRFALAEADEPESKLDGEVEVDETYIGGKARGHGKGYVDNKVPVVSMVERDGRVRSKVLQTATGPSVRRTLYLNVAETANLMTDESGLYTVPGRYYASHETVTHKDKEYARRDPKSKRLVTTNTAEGYFGNSKRSLDGTHHHVSEKYLPLYMAELDYKYSTRKLTDGARTVGAIEKVKGKRLRKDSIPTPKKRVDWKKTPEFLAWLNKGQ